MTWGTRTLNDGNKLPSIAFGTGSAVGQGQGAADQVDQAFSLGFDHIDTAQSYKNEKEIGLAIKQSGLSREAIYVTTKYSIADKGQDVEATLRNSLRDLGLSYVDLYLIHHPDLAVSGIQSLWEEFENVKKEGLAKSIGVSNFDERQLETLLATATITPAVNQIILNPYVWDEQSLMVTYAARRGILTQAFSPLKPLTKMRGPLDKPLEDIARKHNATPDQILLAWTRYKLGGGIVITTSSKKERLQGYLHAANLTLADEDIVAIDAAGAKGTDRDIARRGRPLLAFRLWIVLIIVVMLWVTFSR